MAEADRTMTLTKERQPIPIADVVTGRGFITGKSGSGKSNTASVLCEELLDEGIPLMIVDTDGEYYGLKEEYELLHVGGDDRCDLRIGPQHAEKIAEISLGSNVPIILDVSGFIEESDSKRLVHDVVRELFVKEKRMKIPYLLLIEEAHEFIPEKGGLDEAGEMLVRVAKRGRKRGLGVCAMSQRPASVSKDFITQCDWIVWHRLTWKNDTKVVSRIMGSGTAEEVQNLEPGEAIMLADWEEEKFRVKFRRKRTLDAGATPDLDGLDQPETKSVRSDIVDELEDAGASLTKRGEEADWDGSDGHGNEPPQESAPVTDRKPEETPDGEVTDAPAPEEPADSTDEESAIDQAELDDASGTAAGSSAGQSGQDAPDATEDALERAARSVAAGEPVTASTGSSVGSSASGGGRDRRPRRHRPDPDPADDPVWEVAEFVAYLISTLGVTAVRLGERIDRAISHLLGPGASSRGRSGRESSRSEGRPFVGLVVAAMLLLVGVVVGVSLAMWI